MLHTMLQDLTETDLDARAAYYALDGGYHGLTAEDLLTEARLYSEAEETLPPLLVAAVRDRLEYPYDEIHGAWLQARDTASEVEGLHETNLERDGGGGYYLEYACTLSDKDLTEALCNYTHPNDSYSMPDLTLTVTVSEYGYEYRLTTTEYPWDYQYSRDTLYTEDDLAARLSEDLYKQVGAEAEAYAGLLLDSIADTVFSLDADYDELQGLLGSTN